MVVLLDRNTRSDFSFDSENSQCRLILVAYTASMSQELFVGGGEMS